MEKRKYTGIEVGRVVFACLIPILHIGFKDSIMIDILRQYISRLGVPFFFVVSGMFLSKSIQKKSGISALTQYLKRVVVLILIWMIIYLPLIIKFEGFSIREIIFRTPAYLWYLVALLVAAIPFCLLSNRRLLYWVAFSLYIIGTLFGDTYSWLTGGCTFYKEIFITTRNGVFFGLPLMCVGELSWKKRYSIYGIFISGLLLVVEITFVGLFGNSSDRSMYLFLPIFMFYFMRIIKEWNPKIDTRHFGKISSAIYLMQYGIITGCMIVINNPIYQWITYILVIAIPLIFYYLVRNTKIVRLIF